jgi:protein CpxP
MKTTIKLLALAFIMLVGANTFAQASKKGNPKPQHNHMNKDSVFAKVSKRLNLSADQQTKLKVIMKQNQAEMKSVKESNQTASKEERRKALLAQRQKNDQRVKEILNDSQKAEYEKLKAERKAEKKKKREAHKALKKAPAEIKMENEEKPNDEDILEESVL